MAVSSHFRHVIGGDLTSAHFTTRLKAMPNLAGRLADVTRTDAVLDYRPIRRPWAGLGAPFADTLAARETGFLNVSTPGRYKVPLCSEDGAKVWLDGAPLVKNGGIHPIRARIKAVTLRRACILSGSSPSPIPVSPG